MTTQAPSRPVQVKKPAGPSMNFATVLKSAAPWMHPDKLATLAEEFARADAKRMGLGLGGGDQVITGPTTAYDDATGQPKFRLGEGGADEHVSITPANGEQRGPQPGPDGLPGYEVGGNIWTNPNYLNEIAALPKDPAPPPVASSYAAPAAGPSPGPFQPPRFAAAGGYPSNPVGAQWQSSQNVIGATTRVNQAQSGVLGAQGQYNNTQAATLGPSYASIAAQRATLGPSYAVSAAKAAGLQARTTQNAAQASYLAEQARENQTRQDEFAQVDAAAHDAEDIKAVGQAQLYRNSTNKRYGELGATAPVEVDLPQGYQGQLPGGVVGKLSTHEDQLTKEFTASDKGRSFAIEAARIATAQTGSAVTAADILEGRAQITLDQAQLAVKAAGLDSDEAQLAVKAAGYNVNNAELDKSYAELGKNQMDTELARSKQPPQPGEVLYTDPANPAGGSTWMTPLARAQKMREDELRFGDQNQSTQYSKDPTWGAMSDSEVLNQLATRQWADPKGAKQAVIEELMRRGYSQVQANMLAEGAAARNRGGSAPVAPTLGG